MQLDTRRAAERLPTGSGAAVVDHRTRPLRPAPWLLPDLTHALLPACRCSPRPARPAASASPRRSSLVPLSAPALAFGGRREEMEGGAASAAGGQWATGLAVLARCVPLSTCWCSCLTLGVQLAIAAHPTQGGRCRRMVRCMQTRTAQRRQPARAPPARPFASLLALPRLQLLQLPLERGQEVGELLQGGGPQTPGRVSRRRRWAWRQPARASHWRWPHSAVEPQRPQPAAAGAPRPSPQHCSSAWRAAATGALYPCLFAGLLPCFLLLPCFVTAPLRLRL